MSIDENDSIIDYLLKFNATEPVRYRGKLIPKGELEKMLDKLPTQTTEER